MKIRLVKVNIDDCMELLTGERRFCSALRAERTQRIKNEKRRLQSYAAELVLSFALSGKALVPPVYRYAENGRPIIENGFISISHSGNYAVCAYADLPVGADIERRRRVSPLLSRRILTENERLAFRSSEGNDYLLGRFVMKEAFFKLTGEGLGGGFSQVEETGGMILRRGEPCGYALHFEFDDMIGCAATYEKAEIEISDAAVELGSMG